MITIQIGMEAEDFINNMMSGLIRKDGEKKEPLIKIPIRLFHKETPDEDLKKILKDGISSFITDESFFVMKVDNCYTIIDL